MSFKKLRGQRFSGTAIKNLKNTGFGGDFIHNDPPKQYHDMDRHLSRSYEKSSSEDHTRQADNLEKTLEKTNDETRRGAFSFMISWHRKKAKEKENLEEGFPKVRRFGVFRVTKDGGNDFISDHHEADVAHGEADTYARRHGVRTFVVDLFSKNVTTPTTYPRDTRRTVHEEKEMLKENYYTEDGLKKSKKELNHLKGVELPAVIQSISSTPHGPELDAAKERHTFLTLRIAELEKRHRGAKSVKTSEYKGRGKVRIGHKVKIKDQETGEKSKYHIVGEYEADFAKGQIAHTSPLAKSILGKRKGDKVSVNTPSGSRNYTIMESQINLIKKIMEDRKETNESILGTAGIVAGTALGAAALWSHIQNRKQEKEHKKNMANVDKNGPFGPKWWAENESKLDEGFFFKRTLNYDDFAKENAHNTPEQDDAFSNIHATAADHYDRKGNEKEASRHGWLSIFHRTLAKEKRDRAKNIRTVNENENNDKGKKTIYHLVRTHWDNDKGEHIHNIVSASRDKQSLNRKKIKMENADKKNRRSAVYTFHDVGGEI